MEERFTVYEINEKELDEVIGGDDIPHIGPVMCGMCGQKPVSRHGFVVKTDKGSLLKVHFSKSLCDDCAQNQANFYSSLEFVTWL